MKYVKLFWPNFDPPLLVRGAFLSRWFCPGWFLSVPLLYIRYNRKLNITFSFRFHMYEKNWKRDVTCSWTSCHKLSHLLGPPTPSSVTYFIDAPNGLPLALRLLHRVHSDTFYPSLKIVLLSMQGLGALLSSNLRPRWSCILRTRYESINQNLFNATYDNYSWGSWPRSSVRTFCYRRKKTTCFLSLLHSRHYNFLLPKRRWREPRKRWRRQRVEHTDRTTVV